MIGSFTKPKNKSESVFQTTAFTWASSGTQPAIGTGQAARTVIWSREGEFMNLECWMKIGSSGSSAGTGTYYIEVKIPNPAGGYYFIDADKMFVMSSSSLKGLASVWDLGTAEYDGVPSLNSAGDSTNGFRLSMNIQGVGGTYLNSSLWTASTPNVPAAGDEYYINTRIPISGWKP